MSDVGRLTVIGSTGYSSLQIVDDVSTADRAVDEDETIWIQYVCSAPFPFACTNVSRFMSQRDLPAVSMRLAVSCEMWILFFCPVDSMRAAVLTCVFYGEATNGKKDELKIISASNDIKIVYTYRISEQLESGLLAAEDTGSDRSAVNSEPHGQVGRAGSQSDFKGKYNLFHT